MQRRNPLPRTSPSWATTRSRAACLVKVRPASYSLLLVLAMSSAQPFAVTAFPNPFLSRPLKSAARSVPSKDSSRTDSATRIRHADGRQPTACMVVIGTAFVRPHGLAAALRGQDDEEFEDDEDLVRLPRRGRGRGGGADRGVNPPDRERAYYNDGGDEASTRPRPGRAASLFDGEYDDDEGYDSDYEDDEDYDDDDDDDDWALDPRDIDTSALLENVVIPNPLLDSIDPDGAADRFPELARDPRFWFDMALFIAFLNFLSAVGPRDPYPDLPWF